MRKLTSSWWLFGMLLACSSVRSQQPFTWHGLDGATATAVAVLWSHGYDDDAPEQCGLSRVLTSCRFVRARAAVPGLLASGMSVCSDHALVFGVVTAGDVAACTAFLSALLDDSRSPGDDQLQLAIARAALAADDAEFLYPGTVLATQARRVLCVGSPAARPPDGVATAIARLTPAEVRRRLRDPVAVVGGGLGVVTAPLVAAVERLSWPSGSYRPSGRSIMRAYGGRGEAMRTTHSRADSPFVAAAFLRPADGVGQAEHTLAIEVGKLRAQRRFRSRGSEAFARAPFVNWSWRTNEPLVVFCRRGEDPVELLKGQPAEADAEAEAGATFADLRGLLADLRETPVSAAEVDEARLGPLGELYLPGPGVEEPWAGDPASLPGRLTALLLARHHGIDVAELTTVSAEDVSRALTALLTGPVSWHMLLPEPRKDRGFRPR